MVKMAASPTRIYLDEFDFSGSMTATSLDITQEAPVATCFSDAGPRRVVGNYEFAQSHSGLFEPTDDGFDEQIFALLADGTDHYLTQLFGANAAGNVAYDSIVQLTAEPRSAAVGGAILLNFDTAGAGGLSRGLVLAKKTSTGAETFTGYNMGATVAGTQFRVIYRVLSLSPATNITLTIQESSDDAATDPYAAIVGLAATFNAVGVESDTVIIATEAWKRVVTTGTYTSALILVTAGVVQGTVV